MSATATLALAIGATTAVDPATVVGSALAMLFVGLIAAPWQARRLAAVSPALGWRGQEVPDRPGR